MTRAFVSFPKSGRTWIRFLLDQLGLAESIQFHHDNFEFNDGSRPPIEFNLEKRLAKYRRIDRVIYLRRDPRDLMVSFYHQITGRFRDFYNYQGTLSEFIRDDYFGAHQLAGFRAMWDELGKLPNILTIDYEQCHRQLHEEVRRILNHYELGASDEAIQGAIDAASFTNMKRVEETGSFDQPWLRRRNDAPKVRRGLVHAYKDDLSPADICYLNQVFHLS